MMKSNAMYYPVSVSYVTYEQRERAREQYTGMMYTCMHGV